MSYVDKILSIPFPRFEEYVHIATEQLSEDKRRFPWIGLNHGVELLNTDEELCQYLCSYGKIHQEKIQSALDTIIDPAKVLSKHITVVDWGCGQGLATCCLLDYLYDKNVSYIIDKSILIEPSEKALNRACLHVNGYLRNVSKIKLVNKYIDEVKSNDITSTSLLTVHFFSNVLDIPTINLDKLAKLIKTNAQGEQLFFCVGPTNSGSSRIDILANKLGIQEEDIIKRHSGALKTRGTIKLLVFRMIDDIVEIVKTEFYSNKINKSDNIIMIERMLAEVSTAGLSPLERILYFYKLVVELEQRKEPEIQNYYPYPINFEDKDKDKRVPLIDLPCNEQFLQMFERNRDIQQTRWPLDLNVSINILKNNQSFKLFVMAIAYDDIKDIDINKYVLPCKIADFSVNRKVADEMHLSQEIVESIENAICKTPTMPGMLSAVQELIDSNATLSGEIYLALSQKNPALSQIYSELKKISAQKVESNPLLSAFISNDTINNQLHTMDLDDLIEVTPLDKTQREAVQHAMNDRLSVVTGPPGTGKTQVILNILANALINGKKVLVASKNNKAVDNVKERFDQNIETNGYMLRFGTKKHINEQTLPEINRVLQELNGIQDNSAEFIRLNDYYLELLKQMHDAKATLKHKEELMSQFLVLEQNIEEQLQSINQCNILHLSHKSSIESKYSSVASLKTMNTNELNKYLTGLKMQRNVLQSRNSGFGKLWHNWFSKKKFAAELLNCVESYSFEVKLTMSKLSLKTQVASFKNIDEIIIQYQTIIDFFSKIQNLKQELVIEDQAYSNDLNNLEKELINKQNEYIKIKDEVNEITTRESNLQQIIECSRTKIKSIGSDLLTAHIHHNKQQKDARQKITNYRNYLPDNLPWKQQAVSTFIEHTCSFLDIFNLISVTSLSVKGAFPLKNELFDMVVIDEASQCDIASAIPLILRTKQLVVIGDPMQLKHITAVKAIEEKEIRKHLGLDACPFLQYAEHSLWDYCRDLLTKANGHTHPIILQGHYRCHPDIIRYSNEMFYERRMNTRLDVKTDISKFAINPKGIVMVDVRGRQESNLNCNNEEAREAVKIAVNVANQYPNATIGIVTPFRHQAEQLNYLIPRNLINTIEANTVHKFQGNEKDVMIYSLVVTDNSPETKIRWIDHTVPNLVNVAVTRARNTLYIVGNASYIKAHSKECDPLGYLIRYAEQYTHR